MLSLVAVGAAHGSWTATSLSAPHPEGSALGLFPSMEGQQGQWWAGYSIHPQAPFKHPCLDSHLKSP